MPTGDSAASAESAADDGDDWKVEAATVEELEWAADMGDTAAILELEKRSGMKSNVHTSGPANFPPTTGDVSDEFVTSCVDGVDVQAVHRVEHLETTGCGPPIGPAS